jgi:hypothetical protein
MSRSGSLFFDQGSAPFKKRSFDEVDLRNAPFTDGARSVHHAALRRESEEIQATVLLPDNGERDNW